MRRFVAAVVVAGVAGMTVAPAGATTARAKAPAWNVGDCFASADVANDEVDLSSKVACAEEHAAQIVAGTKLPKSLASAPRAALLTPGTDDRGAVEALATVTCGPEATAKALYPRQAKALAKLFAEYSVDEWMVPAGGVMGWALPDAASFDAGATSLLCVFVPDATQTVSGSSAGDIFDIATKDPLESLRLCLDFVTNGTTLASCDAVHDGEVLAFVPLPVAGLPDDVSTWHEGQWATYDQICSRFTQAMVGAPRKDLKVRGDTNPAAPAVNGTRVFMCWTYPAAIDKAFPAGLVVTGLGKQKIRFAAR